MPDDLKFGNKGRVDKPTLKLRTLLTGVIPDHPPQIDYLPDQGWRMGLNNRHGTCFAVWWANSRRQITRRVGREQYPTDEQIVEFYKTQNPGFDPAVPDSQDDGMYPQVGLEHLHKVGGPDGVKLVAFAELDPTDEAEVEAATAIFQTLQVGTAVQRANMTQFRNGQPWEYVPGSPIDGYHAVLEGGYDSDRVGGDQKMITWATKTAFTTTGFPKLVDQVFVAIWPEHFETRAFADGIDLAKFRQAYQNLTGRQLPVPEPPDPETTDQDMAAAFKRWRSSRRNWSGKTAAGQLVKIGNEWLEEKNL